MRHAYQRLRERTDLHPRVIGRIEREVDNIPEGDYYVPIERKNRLIGYAGIKRLKNRTVVTTILKPHMRTRGVRISPAIKVACQRIWGNDVQGSTNS